MGWLVAAMMGLALVFREASLTSSREVEASMGACGNHFIFIELNG
jgi:hypothetical protein